MIIEIKGIKPNIDKKAFIANSADVIGDVLVGKDSSIWFGTVLRGDINYIHIGEGSNIQDNSSVHVDYTYPVKIGNGVTIGHGAIIHGCTIADECLIGMGAIILNGAVIGKNTIIAAGSLIPQNKVIPEGVLVMGSPGKVIRELSKEEIEHIKASRQNYIDASNLYKK